MKRTRVLALAAIALTAGTLMLSTGTAVGGTAAAKPVPKVHVRPDAIHQVCDEAAHPTHAEHCIQGTFNNAITLQPVNGNPNQQFDFFLPGPGNTSCGDDVSDVNCPFPGVTPGEQIVVVGGQSATNAGHCVAFTSLRTAPNWAPCNGGTGTIAVLDGFAVEFAAVSRQNGGKTYMCENPLNSATIRTVFTAGDCQWSDLLQ